MKDREEIEVEVENMTDSDSHYIGIAFSPEASNMKKVTYRRTILKRGFYMSPSLRMNVRLSTLMFVDYREASIQSSSVAASNYSGSMSFQSPIVFTSSDRSGLVINTLAISSGRV